MTPKKDSVTRRQMLARLGLAAGAAYVAPTMMGLNAARASGTSAPSAASAPSAPSAASAPSAPSGPSAASAPSRNSGPSGGGRDGAANQTNANTAEMPRWMRQMLGI